MKARSTMQRVMLLFALSFVAIGSASSQQPAPLSSTTPDAGRKAASYSFISPNTRENLTLEEALRLLKSREEVRLLQNIQSLTRCLRLQPFVTKAIGSSTDGAEHSALFRVFTDQQIIRYADARLGKLARQKTVLLFREEETGSGRMYVLRIHLGKRTLRSVSQTLDRNGVPFRTLIPGRRQRLFIYVVDLSNELPNEVVRAARNLGAVMTTVRGTGEFIGDDADRDRAQQVFAGIIRQFEDEHPEVARRCSRQAKQ